MESSARAQAALLAGVSAPAAQAVASIYVTVDGQRECDDWKVPLPIGRNLLYTAPQAQADARDALKPDMFWNADDPESSETSINNVVVEAGSYRGLKVGDEVQIQRAVALPDLTVRITMVPDSEGNGDLQWEEVDAAIAAQAAQQTQGGE
ncbi:MAG: hypothetical protein RR800_14235 [Comamonas sp.]